MKKKYFGTDGIRGTAYEFITEELSFNVGQAIAKVFKPETIVIGCDTRESSEMIVDNISKGVSLAGVNVLNAGVVSTPMLAYYSKEKKLIGVMITASHNPYQDNGIKIFKYGYKMLDTEEKDMESYIDDNQKLQNSILGTIFETQDVIKLYQSFYESLNLESSNIKLVFDTANGATYSIAPRIIGRYLKNTYQIGGTPDGKNINLNVGSTHLNAIKDAVVLNQADLGFSFDGDGDRILVVDNELKTYDGDMINYIIAKYLKSKDQLKNDTVVLTKMSNPGFVKAFKDLGIKVILTDVGDKYVSHEIITGGYSIGGEASGHIILNDLLPSGDGLLVGMYLTKILTENNTTLKAYTKELISYPLTTVNIKNIDKEVVSNRVVLKALEDAKILLGSDSLLLVRASGTEPLVRVTVSHKDENIVNHVSNALIELIKKVGTLQ